MTFEDKKRFTIELIRLGMDLYSAAVSNNCTDDDIAKMEEDEDFLYLTRKADAEAEAIFLQRMNDLSESNFERGISVETRWLLEKRWPAKYGTKVTQVQAAPDIPMPNLVIKDREDN